MSNDTTIPPIKQTDEFELKKLQNEISLQEIDKRLKEKELKRKTILQPTFVTVLVAIIGLIGAGITGYLQRKYQLEIEEKKFQYSVYQKALESRDNVTAAKILDFYIKAGLIPGEEGKYTKLLKEGRPEDVPVYSGIYKNINLPDIDNSDQLSLVNNFIKGKGTKYVLSYNAKDRIKADELTTIVLHCTSSSNMKATIRVLTDTVNMKASAHILIDRDGQVIQLVPFNFISFHVGKYNKSSIGIELINNGQLEKTDSGYFNFQGTKIDDDKVSCNSSGKCWEKYSDAQIETALTICQLLVNNFKIKNIVGHSEVDNRRNDPGPFFPIEKFKALIK